MQSESEKLALINSGDDASAFQDGGFASLIPKVPHWSAWVWLLMGLAFLTLPVLTEELFISSYKPVMEGCSANSTGPFSLDQCFSSQNINNRSCLSLGVGLVLDVPALHRTALVVVLRSLLPVAELVLWISLFWMGSAHSLSHRFMDNGVFIPPPRYSWLVPAAVVLSILLLYTTVKTFWQLQASRSPVLFCTEPQQLFAVLQSHSALSLFFQNLGALVLNWQGGIFALFFTRDAFGRVTLTRLMLEGGPSALQQLENVLLIRRSQLAAAARTFLENKGYYVCPDSLPLPVYGWDGWKLRRHLVDFIDFLKSSRPHLLISLRSGKALSANNRNLNNV